MQQTFEMQSGWRLALLFMMAVGVAGMVIGIAAPAVLDEIPSPMERALAAVVGAFVLCIAMGANRRGRCTIDDEALRYLDFTPIAKTRVLPFESVARWGYAVASNQGRRDPLVLFELRDGSHRTMKLGLYRDQATIRERLAERLGPAAPAKATMSGIRFEE